MEDGEPALDRGTAGFLSCEMLLCYSAEHPKNTTPAQVERKQQLAAGPHINARGGALG